MKKAVVKLVHKPSLGLYVWRTVADTESVEHAKPQQQARMAGTD
jgi:hypothetical protein